MEKRTEMKNTKRKNSMIPKKVFVSGLFACGLLLSGADYSRERDDVQSGKITEAKAVWWGYDKEDATKCLQDAMNSGAKKVIVENVGSDWITGPLLVPSNIEVVFNDGVVIRAKKGDFKKNSDALFKIFKQKNVTLRGIGKVLFVMNKKDYQDKANYKPAEHRHTIGIQESDGVAVDNLTLRSSGGDGVYVGSMDCRNVRLTNLVCEDHHRQGLSVTGVKNLYVKNCKFNDTDGTAPECGLDLEPNYKDGVGLQNVVFENCEFKNNNLAGIYISNNSELPTTITFRDCVIKDNRNGGIGLGHTAMGAPDKPGKIEFIRCRIEGHKTPSVNLGLHIVPNLKLVFEDCFIDNRLSKYNAMILSSDSPKDLYGIEIRNLTVIDDQDRAPVLFNSKYGNALIQPVVENVVVKNSKGEEKKFDCAKFIRESAPDPAAKAFQIAVMDRANFLPVSGKGENAGDSIRFRGNTDYYVFAKAGSRIPIRFTNEIVHAYDNKPLEIVLSTPTVPNVKTLAVPYKGSLDYTLEAQENGIYKFAVAARGQTVKVSCSAPGQAFSSSDKLYVFGCSGTLYFAVPAGTKTVRVEAGGSLREESDAALVDPSGKVVAEARRLAGSKILSAERKDPSLYEVWSVRFNASKLFLRLGSPVVQIFSTSPLNLLVEKNSIGKYEMKSFKPVAPVVQNGNFMEVGPSRKDLTLTTPTFPKFWSGHSAGLVTTEDHRNHIEFTNLLWHYLSLPPEGGKFVGKITASGEGNLTAYLSTFTEKGKSHKRRAPDFGPFALKAEPQTFRFEFETKPGENGYLYIQFSGGAKAKARVDSVEMEKAE